ncbi:MAG: hypothetical protein JW714_00955 [Candidatus Omnitrophica bacterium]|nr:hypothetical protein [Candidatus Omnitrophota bacterium]
MLTILGAVAATILPLFNISFMLRIRRRKSSNDISLVWTYGIFFCTLAMLPAALLSPDATFKVFGIANFILFSGVVYHVAKYRKAT